MRERHAYRTIQRRMRGTGIKTKIENHTLRANVGRVARLRPTRAQEGSKSFGAVSLAESYNCPADFRSAAKVASAITSVQGLLLKGAAP